MPSICFYFKIHQPERLKRYTIFDIGSHNDYFDHDRNKFYLDRITHKCYLPTLALLKDLIRHTDGAFKVSFGITGVFLDQLQRWHPEVIEAFEKLAKTGAVEFTGETYYHALASLFSQEEFAQQVVAHREKIKNLFGLEPTVLSNTELVFFDALAPLVKSLGFSGVLAEGVPWILGWRSPNFVYHARNYPEVKIILRNYQLSDDMSFRFSSRDWQEWPLTADKFASWIAAHNGNGEVIGLLMDFETFGEHQWQETGIFDFLRHFPFEVLRRKDLDFKTPSQVIAAYPARGDFGSEHPITWADTERDLTAWLGNQLQQRATRELYELEPYVKDSQELLDIWRKLQTADHFYYMCTKWFADGDVHKYFNPYESPYEAFLTFMNVLEDFKLRLTSLSPTAEPS